VPDGIELILADHQRVDALFTTFDETGDPTVIGQVVDALTAHDDAEHSALYPLAGRLLGDTAMIERLTGAHSEVKAQIDRMKATEGPELVAAFAALRKLVQAHVKDEETKLLPKLREAAEPQDLEVLGARILATKQRVG
jgi:hemerythrin superfamily protein